MEGRRGRRGGRAGEVEGGGGRGGERGREEKGGGRSVGEGRGGREKRGGGEKERERKRETGRGRRRRRKEQGGAGGGGGGDGVEIRGGRRAAAEDETKERHPWPRHGSSPAHPAASAASGRSPPSTRRQGRRHRPRHLDPRRPGGRSTATRSCRSSSTSPTGTPTSRPSGSAHDHFGRLDVVVNNAGYGQFGFIEELSEAGGPRRRSRPTSSARSGSPRRRCRSCARRAAATSSRCPRSAGSRAFPNIGIYHASKWALEGFSQSLAAGGRRLRHQGHADRAGRLLAPTGPAPRPGTPRRTRPTTRYREKAAEQRGQRGPPGRPGGDPGRRSCRSSTPRTRRCGSSSATAR